MVKNNQARRNVNMPQPEVTHGNNPEPQPQGEVKEAIDTHGGMHSPKVRKSLWDTAANRDSEKMAKKAQLMGTIGQQLAQLSELSATATETSAEAEGIASNAATALFRAVVQDKVIGLEEVNALLGDKFGFKKKGDAKVRVSAGDANASVTPFGTGEVIRKRIIRGVQASEYVNDGTSTRFFEGLPEDEVQAVIEATLSEDGSIWRAYAELGKLRQDNAGDRPDFYADPAKIAGFVAMLTKQGAAQVIAQSDTLQKVYKDLREAIDILGEEAQAWLDKNAKEG